MSKQFWRVIQAVTGVAIIVFIGLRLADDWSLVTSEPIEWHFRWEFIIASLLVTWVMYGLLIWGWRAVLHGWRQYIRAVDAARIWCLSSLGKYIPGKVWSIAGMAAMSEKQGVSGVAAIGSAVIMQLVSLATGAVVALMFTGTVVLDRVLAPYTPYGSLLAFAGAAFALLCAFALTLPSLTRRLGHLIGKPGSVQPVEPGALAGALFVNFLAWGGYGLAFQLLLLRDDPVPRPELDHRNRCLRGVLHRRLPRPRRARRPRRAGRGAGAVAEGITWHRTGGRPRSRLPHHAHHQRNRRCGAVPSHAETVA
ncbi:MAG: hypothetical protein IPJ11_13930 [Gemmatimonadetes bacterium]|nr:hypothetical protein [Gemmatimonadota bacterium]